MSLREPAKYAKAIVGAATAALTTLLPLVRDGVSLEDAILAAIAALGTFSAVYWMPNKK